MLAKDMSSKLYSKVLLLFLFHIFFRSMYAVFPFLLISFFWVCIDNQPINYIEKTWCCFVENVPLF